MDPQAMPSALRETSVSERVRLLADRIGEVELAGVCAALLTGADPRDHRDAVAWLSGHRGTVEEQRAKGWKDYWFRTWGARGLLYVWDEAATSAVVAGLADEHWRPAEMCLKVGALRELGQAGEGAGRLAPHELPRVRAAALRLLGTAGDTEHVDVVRAGLDDPEEQVRRAAARALDRMAVRLDVDVEAP